MIVFEINVHVLIIISKVSYTDTQDSTDLKDKSIVLMFVYNLLTKNLHVAFIKEIFLRCRYLFSVLLVDNNCNKET